MSSYRELMMIYSSFMMSDASLPGTEWRADEKSKGPEKSWLTKVIEMPKEKKIKIASTPDLELPDNLIPVKRKLEEYGYNKN